MGLIVTKRDGRKVPFDKDKIRLAIESAFVDIDKELDNFGLNKAKEIANYIESLNKNLSVEEIQDIVEYKLMSSSRKDVAKAYILYRNERNKARERNSALMKDIKKKVFASDVQNQNANVDEKSFGGRLGEAASTTLRQFAKNFLLSEKSLYNHENNMIYIHDFDHYPLGDHNCLTIPFDDLLANGFNTRQTDVRPANSINTAFQLVAVLFQLQSLQQFGGCSASHLDWTMVPYVRKSFWKHYKDGLKYICNLEYVWEKEFPSEYQNTPELCSIDKDMGIADQWEKAYNYAMDMTEKELHQAVEGMYHNLNTLQSRSGNQLPFTSINYGTCTLPEGRMVTKALLEGSIKGVGKLHKTPIFPCGIFQCMAGVNRKPEDPNYDLFQLALKSTSIRLYPNYANVDWSGNAGYDRIDPRTYFSTMGKRKL